MGPRMPRIWAELPRKPTILGRQCYPQGQTKTPLNRYTNMGKEEKVVPYKDTISAAVMYALDELKPFFNEEAKEKVRTSEDLVNKLEEFDDMQLAKLMDGVAALNGMLPSIFHPMNTIWLKRMAKHGNDFMKHLESFAGTAESATNLAQRIAQGEPLPQASSLPLPKVVTSSEDSGNSRLN